MHWDKDKIKNRISKINRSSRGHAYFVLTDQDTLDRCPPVALAELPEPVHHNLLYRFPVMEIESWVIAHREEMADFLSVPLNRIPIDTDTILKPKEQLVNWARRYGPRGVKGMVPTRLHQNVGEGYNSILSEFVETRWDVHVAIQHSPSLERAFNRLKNFQPQL